ncbi:cupin [Georgenia sp. 10Sc9-8]|uniref:Cupin n=1 Tax=Georgenia halotolerans TaxID=3028317 RepID=A0ABT5U2A5_9MICO|nr:cupin [Georgenia halotolerans]
MPDLDALATSHLEAARASEHGRSAELLVHDGPLRQSILALVSGAELAEHNSPHAASLQVLVGTVRVTGEDEPEISAGELHKLTHERHAVTALADSVFLLTTVTGLEESQKSPEAR